MPNYNRVRLTVYARNSTTVVNDAGVELPRAQDLSFNTIFPGGLYGTCSFTIPRDVTRSWAFEIGQRVVARNGLTVVYEGTISNVGYEVGAGAWQARTVECTGGWGWTLAAQGWRKPWADSRMSDSVWVYQTGTTGGGDQSCTLDRLNRLRFTPKGVAWASGDYAAVRYTAPVGETVKRVTYNYDFAEGAQAWEIVIYNVGTAADIAATSITTSGTGSVDHTLATPSQSIEARFYSRAAQTPTEDGTYYGQFSSVVVYTETGSINGYEIAKDIRARATDINSDETNLSSSLSYALVPFTTEPNLDWEMYADILQRAVSFGDASFNQWYARLIESDKAATPNGKPVLELAQYPALTDYDYAVRINEPNVGPFKVVKDGSGVYNYIILRYTDENGNEQWLTPSDDANLTDATSVAAYGQRETVINCGQVTTSVATNWGRRLLAQTKDPKFYVSGPITVVGYIRAKNGQRVPAANIQARKRVKIENFLTDEVSVTGAGLTFYITQTDYTDKAQMCSMSVGVPDNLAVFLAKLMAGKL